MMLTTDNLDCGSAVKYGTRLKLEFKSEIFQVTARNNITE